MEGGSNVDFGCTKNYPLCRPPIRLNDSKPGGTRLHGGRNKGVDDAAVAG